jgi:hypothetical protein
MQEITRNSYSLYKRETGLRTIWYVRFWDDETQSYTADVLPARRHRKCSFHSRRPAAGVEMACRGFANSPKKGSQSNKKPPHRGYQQIP